MTEWRTIEGFNYKVSEAGEVFSLYSNRIIGSRPNGRAGYLQVALFTGCGKAQWHFVHRLVAAAFIGPCPEGFTVNHKNGKKRDNTPDNLEYCTAEDNRAHAKSMGLIAYLGNAKLTQSDVDEIRARHKDGATYKELAGVFGVDRSTIGSVVRGRSWQVRREQ